MDAKLRHELRGIAGDRRSGAAELAARALAAVEAWRRRHPRCRPGELRRIAARLAAAQPAMAPLRRLAAEVARAAAGAHPAAALAASLGGFRDALETAPERIARAFARHLRARAPSSVFTYSYSSTVLRALRRGRARVSSVACAESRPGCEGRAMASGLAKAGVKTVLLTDAAWMAALVRQRRPVVLGADAVLRPGFVNKTGTAALVRLARQAKAPVWVLADTLKLWPEAAPPRLPAGDPREVWANPPPGVAVENPDFDLTPFSPGVRLLTERGWMTPARVRRELRAMPRAAGTRRNRGATRREERRGAAPRRG